MILFWLLCGLFIVIAFAFILPPLLQPAGGVRETGLADANVAVYRDQIEELEADLRNGIVSQEQYQLDRDQIEARLLEDVTTTEVTNAPQEKQVAGRALVYSLVLGMPVLAVLLYLQLGNQSAIKGVAVAQPQSARPSAPSSSQDTNEQERIAGNVAALAKRLEQDPNDADGWAMLGKSYTMLERYADASSAYEKATALKSDDADLLADYAFVLGMANGQSLAGRPTELLQQALKLSPENPKVLQLAGSAAFEARDYKTAIEHWQKVMERTEPDSELGRALAQQLAEARKLNGEKVTR